MSESFSEKTEQPTQKKLEEAVKRGDFPRSAELQTVFVLMGTLLAFRFSGANIWDQLVHAFTGILPHLHEIPLTLDVLPGYFLSCLAVLGRCVGPPVAAALICGLLAGVIQSRFRFAPDVLGFHWERLSPAAGIKQLVGMRAAAPTALAAAKLAAIILLGYGAVKETLTDPIFTQAVDAARIAGFMGETAVRILMRITMILVIIAAVDYAYQFWRNHQDLMMTRQEVKDESKNNEGNPQVKSRLRRRRQGLTKRKMLLEVPKADVVVTNPVRLAVALRYDRKTMRAPKIVAKGSRLNARRIRELAQQHQVPIVENKPLAQLMFKYGRVGGEIPAQLYAAVAEVLAWVYRVNRYRYYAEQCQTQARGT